MFLLAAVTVAPAAADSCVWFSHDDSIRQVQTSINQVTRVVPLRNPHRLLMNAEDCGVWTLDKHDRRILRFSAEGALEREIRIRDVDPRLDEVERLHLDPYSQSLWVTDDRRIFHISSSGTLLGSFGAPGEIRRLRVGLDQTLWVLGKRDLWHFDPAGNLLATHTLGRHLAGDARYFVIDNVGGLIWLADDNELARLKLSDPVEQPPLRIRLQHHITGFTLDPFAGNIWVAQRETLLAFSRAGSLAYSADLEAFNIRKPEKLGFDPASRSIWVGAEKSVSRFSDTGQFVIRFSARDGDEALGVPTFRVQPTLALIRPPPEALTNSPQPEFRLGYGAECNGISCGFPTSYFSAYQLSATLNAQPVGSAFLFDANTLESSFTPSSRLPEGTNSFIAQVNDGFGHSSNSISNAFTVDTIAPRFLTLTPTDGSVFQTPLAMLQGTIDDPQATVVLNGLGLSQTGQTFGFPVVLAPGLNSFTLSALDRAGNATGAVLRLTFVPVSVTIESPANGASVTADSVLMSGTFQGPLNTGVTVNGVIAAIIGNQYFANVPLTAGANTIVVTATAPDGTRQSATVQVTSSGASATRVTGTPLQGIAPLTVTFTITSDQPIQSVNGEFTAGSPFSVAPFNGTLSFTYQQPGAHTAIFNVVRADGTTVTKSLRIVVQSVQEVDQLLRQVWGGLVSALVRGDKSGAMQYLNVKAKAQYEPVFDALLPNMPQIFGGFSSLQSVAIREEIGEYAVSRVIDGVNRIFLIYLLRDGDGVWRVDSM